MTERVIAITGAASGIGQAIALACAERGWGVALMDIDTEGLTATAKHVHVVAGVEAIQIECDVTCEASVARALDLAAGGVGPLRGVVANAGIEINRALHEFPLEDWRSVIDVNLTGCFLTVKHSLRTLLRLGQAGSIVCTSSPSAIVGFSGGGNAAYAASKGGVSAIVRSAAIDYAKNGIRINALVPGATDTPMLRATGDIDTARVQQLAREQIPAGRLARPAEVADAALWLLDDHSTYVTGSHLICDGGLLAASRNTF